MDTACKIKNLAIAAFAAATVVLAVVNVKSGIDGIPGYDFKLRYHEVECIRKGIDPYDIVSKKIPSEEYALFATPEAKPGVKTLHVYTPWEYTYFMPLSLLPEETAGAVFLALSVLALAAVGAFAYKAGRGLRGRTMDGVFTASAAMFLGSAAGELLSVANYGAINALMILLMALALRARRDVLAGMCWAVLMTKPQIGLLFAIPLLLKRRFVAAGTAAAICIACAIPPAVMCGRSPVEMLLEVPRGCAFVAADNGTMLIPSQVFKALDGRVDPGLLGLASMIAGGALCLWLAWRVRKSESWLVLLAPSSVCALIWNYCKPHDRVILWLAQLLLALAALQTRKRVVRVFCLSAILLAAWPLWQDGGAAAKLARRASLACLAAFCWTLPRRPRGGRHANK